MVSLRDSIGEKLTRKDDFVVRWREYFVQLLNGDVMRVVGKKRLERMRRYLEGGKRGDNGCAKENERWLSSWYGWYCCRNAENSRY